MDISAIKVLVADDEPDILDAMAHRLRSEGYEVLTARDGQAAWDTICRSNPDIILLDLIMPKLDGYAVLEKLRKEPVGKKWAPVIIVSAQGEISDIRRGFDLEADHYITKPCRMGDVLKGIQLMVKLIPQRKDSTEE